MTEATLSAKVTADIGDFNRKFGEMHRSLDGLAKGPASAASATSSAADSIEQSTGRWKTAFAAVGTAVAAGALVAVDKIGEWARATAAAAEKVEQISQQTGIAQTTLEQWSVALNRTGTDTAVFAKAFKALSKDIEQARGEADFSKTKFAEMGLALKDLGSTETVIRAVADRIAAMTDPAARAQLATDLLGKAGLALIPAFSQGSAGLDAAGKKAQEFGLVLSASARTDLLTYDDAIDDLGKAWQGFQTKVGAAAAPILTKGVQLAEAAIVMSGKVVDAIVRMVAGVRGAFATLGQLMDGVRHKTDEVKEYFRSLYHAVVGGSYIPDMVDEIGRHMQNLDVAMTAPARTATVATAKIFEGLAFSTQHAMNQVVSTINFAWGSATQGVSQALAQMTSAQVDWAQVGIRIGQQFLAAMLNQIFALMTQWALATLFGQEQNAVQLTAHTAMEAAKTGVSAAANTARLAMSAATNKLMLGQVTATMVAMGAVGNLMLALAGIAILATTAALKATGIALQSTPFTAPAGQQMIGAAIVAAAVGTLALGAGLAALNTALGTAIVAATTALATPFAAGGIVTGPTLALIGEAGPEAVVPLKHRGFGDVGPITIILEVGGRQLGRAVVPHLHGPLRRQAIGV